MTTWLGAADARYRIGGYEGPADTVFLGVFRREALEAAGGFDETLRRNEDYALNWRLREQGRTVWLDPRLKVAYQPRGSLGALARQYFANGWWKRIMLGRHPRSLRWRQCAAPVLALGLAGSAGLAAAGLVGAGAVLPAAYLLALVAGAAMVGLRRRAGAGKRLQGADARPARSSERGPRAMSEPRPRYFQIGFRGRRRARVLGRVQPDGAVLMYPPHISLLLTAWLL